MLGLDTASRVYPTCVALLVGRTRAGPSSAGIHQKGLFEFKTMDCRSRPAMTHGAFYSDFMLTGRAGRRRMAQPRLRGKEIRGSAMHSAVIGILGLFLFVSSFADAATITGTVSGPDGAPFRAAFVQARHAKPSQAKPSQAKPSQAKPSQAKPSQAKPSQAKPSQAKPSQAKPSQAKPSQA